MKNFGLILIFSTLCLFFLCGCGIVTYEGQTAEYWFNEYDYQVAENERLTRIIEIVGADIEEKNALIEEAKDSLGNYRDMYDAIDNLYKVIPVD